MNTAHFHMIVNHLPIVGLIIGMLVLVFGLISKKNDVKYTALGIFVFTGITAVLAFVTGHGAEEIVEDLPGTSETLIYIHEEIAELFLGVSSVLGLVALFAYILIILKKKYVNFLYYGLFILSLAAIIIAVNVGTTGGQIRHPEIRSNNKVIHFNSEEEDQ